MTDVVVETPQRGDEGSGRSPLVTGLLLLPASIWYGALLVLPMAFVVVFSFGEKAKNGGYAPGLVTALVLNLPFSLYLLRRAIREQWLSRPARWALVPGAILLHGPLLAALLLATERL